MIIKRFELNKKVIDKFNFFLLYGKNEGLQNEIIKLQFIKNFTGEIIRYDEVEFLKNNEIIFTELLNKSLFENKKILLISRVTEKILKSIHEITERNLIDLKIILKCGVLEKKSKLRNFFEKGINLATIPFYEDDYKSLSYIVNDFINKNNIKLSRESVNLLVSRASGDRENLKIELNKILNYSYSNNIIELEHVQKLTNLAENFSVSELADSYLNKNIKNISKILNENNYSDEDCILILRTISSKSKRLLTIIERYNETKDIENSISKIKPPIFWKEKDSVKTQVTKWKIGDLKRNIYRINDVEYLIKSNSKNSFNLVSDFVVNF